METWIKERLAHSFNRRNLLAGIKSLLHGLVAVGVAQAIPPHNWQVSFACGLCYGSVMHLLFHYREDRGQERRE